VVKPDRQHPTPSNMLGPAVAPAAAELPVQVGDRLGQPGVVGGHGGPAGGRAA
jgi:hypothetical protein